MKVYVIMKYWYSDSFPIAVHRDKKKALKHKEKHRLYEIEEFNVIE